MAKEQGESNYSTEKMITALCILGHGKKDCAIFSGACQADIRALIFCFIPPSVVTLDGVK